MMGEIFLKYYSNSAVVLNEEKGFSIPFLQLQPNREKGFVIPFSQPKYAGKLLVAICFALHARKFPASWRYE